MRRGFSIAELVLCLGILTVALVFLTSFFVGLYRSTDKSGNTAAGTRAAETVLNHQLHDIFKNTHVSLTKAAFFAADAAPGVSGSLQLGQTEFQYQMDYATVRSSGGGDLGAGLTGNRLKAVTVRCWWAGGQRAGQGRLSVEIHRLVNENDEF